MRYMFVLLAVSLAILASVMADTDSDAEDTFTVTFQMPDGTVLSTQHVPSGGYVDISLIPDPPVPKGAVFLGWGDVTQAITKDTVFTASFSYPSKTYTVRYFADDKTTLMYTEKVLEGSSATYSAIPVKDDSGSRSYTFERWSSDLTSVTSDIDVFPIFKESERMCEVRFFDYDRTLIDVRKVTYGSTLRDMPSDPSREPTIGYTYEFECWSITPNGKVPVSFENVIDTKFAYAYYRPSLAEYTASFILDGQTVGKVVAKYNSQIDASAVLDLRDGYIAKMYRDPEHTKEFAVGFALIGNTDVYVSLVPGIYTCERDASGKAVGGTVRVSHDSLSISRLTGDAIDVCDISQFPNGTIAEIDHRALTLMKEKLGDDAILRISVPRGSIEMSASALCRLSDGKDLSVSILNGPSSVKITTALKKLQYSAYYSLSLKVDGRSVTMFQEDARISFPLSLDEGLNPVAWSITTKGFVTKLESEHDGSRISFVTDSIQYIALGTDTPNPGTKKDQVVLPYGIAEYELSGSSSYGSGDDPQSKLTAIKGDFKGNILFVPSAFGNRPLTHISADAFGDATDVQAIVVPMTVKTFEWLDWSCTAKDIYFLGDHPDYVGTPPSYVKIHCISGSGGWSEDDIVIHDRYLYNGSVGKDAFSFKFIIIEGKAYIDRYMAGSYVVVPRSVMADGREYALSYIGDSAFMHSSDPVVFGVYGLEYGTYSLDAIEIPTTVTEICTLAFRGSTLKNVYGMESVMHIGDGAFRNCASLMPVTLHGSLLYIGESAFQACSSKAFSRITVPSSVEHIGSSAFYGCTGLSSVSLECQIVEIPSSCFAQCSSLTSITTPETVRSIGDSAFYNCSSILYFDLMNTEEVGKSAFQCAGKGSRLECVVFGEPLKSLGNNAFAGCTDLAELEVYCLKPMGMDGAFQGVDIGSIKLYAVSDVARDWSDYNPELLDEPEEEPDRTMTYVVLGMIVFFIILGMLSMKYRTKFE